ncbi:uncharacterized protein C8R40DRAFT_1040167, partial [Lentinula edodes]|uniref:uncharacterized protein n=1 Tax=Lentinula edodes TaxID=5353 RepID=UPI001E8EA6D6
LDHSDLNALSETCRIYCAVVKLFRTSAMKVDKVLKQFFSTHAEIGYFQHLQGATGMIISGSVALAFFNREEYRNSDLDTYCLLKRCLEVGLWYQSIHYAFKPVGKQNHHFHEDVQRVIESEGAEIYVSRNIAEVWNFVRGDSMRIQLVATKIIPEAVILQFHSTCVMNIITQRAAYSLFPNTTFNDNATLVVNSRGGLLRKYDAPLMKYNHRGFQVEVKPSLDRTIGCRQELSFATPRWIGDGRTWIHEVEYFGPGPREVDNAHRISWDMVYKPRQILLEYFELSNRVEVGGEEVQAVLALREFAIVQNLGSGARYAPN